MVMEDYEIHITHRITEKEKQEFGEEHAKRYGFGSVKQWRTVMMIEANLGYKFSGSSYWDLKDFISKYFESAKRETFLKVNELCKVYLSNTLQQTMTTQTENVQADLVALGSCENGTRNSKSSY